MNERKEIIKEDKSTAAFNKAMVLIKKLEKDSNENIKKYEQLSKSIKRSN